MKIEPDKVLVIKRDGEKIVGRKFSRPGSFNIDGHWVKIDGVKYQLADLTAYQDTKAYIYGLPYMSQATQAGEDQPVQL